MEFFINPFVIVQSIFVFACSNGMPDCDKEVRCISVWNMPGCYEKYQGDIHTPAYMNALRVGHNPTHHRRKKWNTD